MANFVVQVDKIEKTLKKYAKMVEMDRKKE